MIPSMGARISGRTLHRVYLCAAALIFLLEIIIALFAHDRLIRPYLGDSLAVILVYCMVRAFMPCSVIQSLAIAMAIACAIELGQLFGLLSFLGLEHNMLARLVLGSGFDLKDFLAYACGICAAGAWEGLLVRMRASRMV